MDQSPAYAGAVAVDGEQLEEVGVVLFGNALEFEDALEVGVGAVADEIEVGLDESLGRGRADLEGLEEGVDLGHRLVDALDVACRRGRRGWSVGV